MSKNDPDKVQLAYELNEFDYATLYYPLPDINEKELLERIEGVSVMPDRRRPDPDRPAFVLEQQWGYGAGKKPIYFLPGEARRLPREVAQQIYNYFSYLGIVLLHEGEDKTEAAIRGLQSVIATLHERGTEPYNKHVLRAGYNEE